MAIFVLIRWRAAEALRQQGLAPICYTQPMGRGRGHGPHICISYAYHIRPREVISLKQVLGW